MNNHQGASHSFNVLCYNSTVASYYDIQPDLTLDSSHSHCNIPQWLGYVTFAGQFILAVLGILLFALIIRRLKNFGNIGVILALLILSCPCYCLQMYYFTKSVSDPREFDGKYYGVEYHQHISNLSLVYEGLNFAFFSGSHWMFAVLMWITSEKLVNMQRKFQDPHQALKYRIILWGGLLFNTVFPITMCFQYKYGHGHPARLRAFKGIVCSLQGVTCLVLTYSVIRIRRVVRYVKGIDIQTGRMITHLSAFWLYFFSYILYYLCYYQNKTRNSYWFVTSILVTVIAETISVALLIYIIWQIYAISFHQQQQISQFHLQSQ